MPTNLEEALKGCKGSRVKMSQVKKWLLDNILDNMNRETRITLNIWSIPGVGKTSLVKSLEREKVTWNGRDYEGFKIVDIPLAQIEEMGDVLGFPVEEIKMLTPEGQEKWIKAVDSLINDYLSKRWTTEGEQRTIYAPPSWVPKEERPGILLFDDGNRASQRIMKGLMQLVQDYRTISWAIPRGWTIIFTGNPDNKTNQVTGMDTAQRTRMKHITLLPDVQEWADWAFPYTLKKELDIRLVQWALKNPEMFTPPNAERTNPRSLTEFARALIRFPKTMSEEDLKWCEIEGNASLDKEVVDSILVFLQKNVGSPIEVEEILNDAATTSRKLKEFMVCSEPRIDIVVVSCRRLLSHLLSNDYQFKREHVANVQAFLTDENMPRDQVLNFAGQLTKNNPNLARQFLNCDKLLGIVRAVRNDENNLFN